jgi:hypothetical protein
LEGHGRLGCETTSEVTVAFDLTTSSFELVPCPEEPLETQALIRRSADVHRFVLVRLRPGGMRIHLIEDLVSKDVINDLAFWELDVDLYGSAQELLDQFLPDHTQLSILRTRVGKL